MKFNYALLPICCFAAFTMGCSEGNDHDADNVDATTIQQSDSTGGQTGHVNDGMHEHQDGTMMHDGADHMHTTEVRMNPDGTPMTPTQERTAVTTDMKGLRATLVADLDGYRKRLSDGTLPEAQRKFDKEMAAELAQGLERVDRALESMGTATDETWASIRESQVKEVDEVRSWMDTYKAKQASAKK